MVRDNNHYIDMLFIWLFTILGWVTKILPIVQLISLLLAIAVSCVSLYKFFFKKGDTQ